jgi:hypothetical protein
MLLTVCNQDHLMADYGVKNKNDQRFPLLAV